MNSPSYPFLDQVAAGDQIRPLRVLLVVTQVNYPNPLPSLDLIPQGPAYVAGSLKAHGHSVRGVCTNYDISGEPAPQVLKRQLAEGIRELQPEVILVGGMAAEFFFLRDAISFARELAPDVPIVCGGSIMTNDKPAMELLKADYCIMDEAEITVIDLLQRINLGLPMDDAKGVGFWKDGEAVYNPLRPAIGEFNTIPFPDYEVLDIENYLSMQNQYDGYWAVRTKINPRMFPISTGRSCPYKCTFCQYSTLEGSRRVYRGRGMEHVIEEIGYFHDRYNFNILKIYDDLFSVKEDRILEFCQRFRESGLNIDWNASMRVSDVTPSLLREMRAAGCIEVGYGFESADDDVLKSMNKKTTRAQMANAIEISEAAGMGVQANFIYGDPAETPETIAITNKFYQDHCHDHIVHHDYIEPYPGSPIYDHCKKIGAIKDRQTYYETIHQRPRYNMTKMPQREYAHLIEKIVRKKLPGHKFLKDTSFDSASREDFKHGYFDEKLLLEVKGTCPHCEETVRYVFPRTQPDLTTLAGRYGLLEPIKFYCQHCHKCLLVSLLPIAGLDEAISNYIGKLNLFAENGRHLVMLPWVEYNVVDILMAYGLRFDDLAIHAFISTGGVPDGTQFLDHIVFSCCPSRIHQYRGAEFVVLPNPDEESYIQVLLKAGIPHARIHAISGHPQASEPCPPINKKQVPTRNASEMVKHADGLWYAKGDVAPFTGTTESFHHSGRKQSEITLKNGRLDGPHLTWYDNDQLEIETAYENDLEHGRHTEWYLNGQKKWESIYKVGGRVSLQGWQENGTQKSLKDWGLDGNPKSQVMATLV